MDANKHRLSESERIDWLTLIRTSGVGPRMFARLIDRYGTARAALEALPTLSRQSRTADKYRRPPAETIRREIDAAHALGAAVIARCEPDYPDCLAAIDDPPPVLFARGDLSLMERPAVAIVGARNASSHGRKLAHEFAADLGAAGCVVVSGLARGIDGAAHTGALRTGTIAAVAGGVDVVYPPEHSDLQAEIAVKGLLVSEHAPGTVPTARHFPARNRLISGLAAGVLVVEAAVKSGSLITARLALEQGRDVFAVPGSPRDPRCRGTNDLIRQGAILTESAEDVIKELDLQVTPRSAGKTGAEMPQSFEKEDEMPPQDIERKIIELLGATPTGVDELVRECHMSAAVVQSALLEMELRGRIERHPGNRISLVL